VVAGDVTRSRLGLTGAIRCMTIDKPQCTDSGASDDDHCIQEPIRRVALEKFR
jgi:hypothetical protein